MTFGRGLTWRAVREMIRRGALHTPTARGVVRKSGFRIGGTPLPAPPTSVLSAGWIVQPHLSEGDPPDHPNDPRGISWEEPSADLPFWPTGDALYTSTADLIGFSLIRNVVFVDPSTPHPDFNVKVEASLDGTTWGDVALDDDWKYSGANVNLGGWPEIIEEAHGGAIFSAWEAIAPEYLDTSVKLRWRFFESEAEGVYDPGANDWGTLIFGYADVQVI